MSKPWKCPKCGRNNSRNLVCGYFGCGYEFEQAPEPTPAVEGDKISRAMFDALLNIVDAKIAVIEARSSSDNGLAETIRESQLIEDFENKFVTSY